MAFDPILCIGLLLVLAGGGSLIGTANIVNKSRQARSWPTVPGEIIYADVRASDVGDQTQYNARVVVRYAVDGLMYESQDRVYAGERSDYNTYEAAQRRVEAFELGEQVTVHYNQRYPDDMTLDPTVSLRTWLGFGVSLTLLVAGIVVSIWSVVLSASVVPAP